MSLDWRYLGACRSADMALCFRPGVPPAGRGASPGARAMCACGAGRAQCGHFAARARIRRGVCSGEQGSRRWCGNGLYLMGAADTWASPEGHQNCGTCRSAADQRAHARQRGEAAA